MKDHPLVRATWPERIERVQSRYKLRVPKWSQLLEESLTLRAELQERQRNGLAASIPRHDHTVYYGTAGDAVPPSQFTMENIHCFRALKSVVQAQAAALTPILDGLTHLSATRRQYIQTQAEEEITHEMYHSAMWRNHGRRVYVLDQVTYDLLALTDLPALPASLLSFPAQSFYLRFPKNALRFSVYRDDGSLEIDTQPCEGVIVSTSHPDPDLPHERDISFLAVGENENDAADLNVAYITMALGPDAFLNQVQITKAGLEPDEAGLEIATEHAEEYKEHLTQQIETVGELTTLLRVLEQNIIDDPDKSKHGEYRQRAHVIEQKVERIQKEIAYSRQQHQVIYNATVRNGVMNAQELGITIPRVILGFLLYLQSEHPDVEPVPPAPRRSFTEIRSPKQREAALENQAKRLRGATALPILYVGRKLAQEAQQYAARTDETPGHKWQLDHAVWVRGHWRQQVAGTGRKERRLTWIRPYRKGPDGAEALRRIAAKKVQQARLKPLAEVSN